MKINYKKRIGESFLRSDTKYATGVFDEKEVENFNETTEKMPKLISKPLLDWQRAGVVQVDPRYLAQLDPAQIKDKKELKSLIKWAVDAAKEIIIQQADHPEYTPEEQIARKNFVEEVRASIETLVANYEAHCQMEGSLNSLVESGEEE